MCNFFKPKNKNIAEVKETETQEVQKETEEIDEDEWEWIEGYKGTDSNMQGFDGFQFELNKEFTKEGEIVICSNGFHFCQELKDTLHYRTLLESRFFKVKALVNMTELIEQRRFVTGRYDKKLVAKKIILTEEVGFEELFPCIKMKYTYVETEQDWEKLKKVGYKQYRRDYFIEHMKDSMFGESFLCILYDEIEKMKYDLLGSTINFAQVLKDENISKDMATYLILKHARGE